MPEQNFRHLVTACLALSAFACSDPVPPPAEAGVYIEIRQSPSRPSGTDCSTPATTQRLGATPPSASNSGTTVIDGEGGSDINCSVKGTGSFLIQASARSGNLVFDITDGEVVPGGQGKAKVSVYTPDSFDLTDPECLIVPIDVKAGAIWASFDCQGLAKPPSTVCGGKGFFVFQNCSK